MKHAKLKADAALFRRPRGGGHRREGDDDGRHPSMRKSQPLNEKVRCIGPSTRPLRLLMFIVLAIAAAVKLRTSPNVGGAPEIWGDRAQSNRPSGEGPCFDLSHPLRRSGSFHIDPRIKNATSPTGISPPYVFASEIAPREYRSHIGADRAHFNLMSEHAERGSKTEKGRKLVALDVGANRGYYTWFLATLGIDVHAFEIGPKMFNTLQHGQLFNQPSVSDRVSLYPVGISDTNGLLGLEGDGGGGFMKNETSHQNSGQKVMSISLDCFIEHVPLPEHIHFIKIDVEGFETAALRGARRLFSRGLVGAMLIEVGPNRWNRAGISLESGIEEMREVAKRFRLAFVLLRAGGPHRRSCPPTLAARVLSDVTPSRKTEDVNMHAMKMEEWAPLLTEMDNSNFDCNFWFSNTPDR